MPIKKVRRVLRSTGKYEGSGKLTSEVVPVQTGVKRKASGDCNEGAKRAKVSRKPKKILVRKERRRLRRQQKESYGLTVKAKLVWEQLRRHNLRVDDRSRLLAELVDAITGHIHELTVKHDTARVVQCCLKYGTPQHRTAIFNELREHVIELSKLKYAKFVAKALLKYCSPSQRSLVITSMYSHVRRLARHTDAAEVLEMAYNDFANAHQRASLVQEFYGPQFALLGGPRGQTLGDVLKSSPDQRAAILKNLKETLSPLLSKKVVHHSIIHRAMLEFFQHCDNTSRTEMIELMREAVVNLLHTKEGSRVALHCLWHGTPKDRKVIVKSFKTYVKKICMEENGHLVMMGLLDCVDDTVLVRKALLSEICDCLGELCDHLYGRRLLLYLLSPRSRQHFSPQFVSILTPGDHNQHSKKPSSVRYCELLEGVSSPLLKLATERVGMWAQSKPHAPLLVQIANSISGDLSPLFVSLVDLLARDFDLGEESHLVAHPCAHWVVRRLLEGEGGGCFAELLLDKLTSSQLQAWVGTNRGAFVACSLLRSKLPGVREKVLCMLQEVLCSLRTAPLKGQQALLSELDR